MNIFRKILGWLENLLLTFQVWIVRLQQKNWVSYHAIKLIRNSQVRSKIKIIESVANKWSDWMHPTRWRSSLFIAICFVILPQIISILIFASGLIPSQVISFLDKEFFSTLWQVFASIIGISFVIIVFLTEYSQSRGYTRRAFPIYAAETSMIFTIMTGLLTLMSMGATLALLGSQIHESNWVSGVILGNFALFFINLILTLILYVKTYQLLSPDYFRTILVKHHKRKILESVSKEFYKRLKQNLAAQFIQKLGIETSILRSENKKRVSIKIQNNLSEPLLVDDINLELIRLASKNAQKLKKEFSKEQFVFSGLPSQNISLEYSEIASVVPELNQRKVLYPLQEAIRTKRRGLSERKTTSDELLINRDLISEAINAGQSENVKTSLDLYIETIDAFLASLKYFGHRFTPELAEREDSWLNRWDILEAVYSEFRSLIEEAIKSNNAEIIHEFVSFPIRVMNKALEYRDHLAFQKFVNMYPRIYILSKQFITNNQLADQTANRCGSLMAEFVNFRLEYSFKEKDLFEDDAKEFLAYAEHVLTVFSQLAKYQIDILDFTQYKLSIGAIQRMLQDFIERHNDYYMYILEVEYQNGNEIQKQEI